MDYGIGNGHTPWRNANEDSSAWMSSTNTTLDTYREKRIADLRKTIREQNVLLSVLEDDASHGNTDIESLKARIQSKHQELCDRQAKAGGTSTQGQMWAKFELNLQRIQDVADEARALKKEAAYLTNTGVHTTYSELLEQTERLNQIQLDLARKQAGKLAVAAGYTPPENAQMTEADRLRAKAQAMVAARLNRGVQKDADFHHLIQQAESEGTARLRQVQTLKEELDQFKQEIESTVNYHLDRLDTNVTEGHKQLRDRQMFERGLYVADEVARFIDQLPQDVQHSKSATSVSLAPSVSVAYAHSPEPMYASIAAPTDYFSLTPPPVPTSQHPSSPKSEADIKLEVQRRIDQRKQLFAKNINTKKSTEDIGRHASPSKETDVSADEKAAQERLRRAEAEARERLQNMREQRAKLRKETEEKRKQAALAQREKEEEQKRLQKEQEEQRKKEQAEIAERQRKEMEERLERQRKEQEEHERRERELALKREQEEKERRERELALKREEEERAEAIRQNRIRLAAEKAAREKRRQQEEIKRKERELEADRLAADKRRQDLLEQRRAAAEAQNQERLQRERVAAEEQRLKELESQRIAAEKEAAEKEAAEREAAEKERRLQEEADRLRQQQEDLQRQMALEQQQLQQEEASKATPAYSSTSEASVETAGTSGYGFDVADEVDFATIYRVKTLYEFRGSREDDLSFVEDEIIKAHPHKDPSSDWWYGKLLSSNQVGFFPRTYVEVIEKAFRVRTLYPFQKAHDDDLAFTENEIIVIQPFQDENGEWWYGTNEETGQSGYFPKTYAEKIDSGLPNASTSGPSTVASSTWSKTPNNQQEILLNVPKQEHRQMSAPNTPVLKKETLNVNKTETAKRRRAASNAGPLSSKNVPINHSQTFSSEGEPRPSSPALNTWASTMDERELAAIPPEERKRQEAIFELIATEKTYLRDLQLIINIFYANSGKYLSREEQDVIFSNIEDILLCNTALLSDLEARQREGANVVGSVGDIFMKHAVNLGCYSTYCRNQSFASRFLQDKRESDQWFDVFLKTAQGRPECRSLDLSHFLLEPVQRITRYPLLLRQILNATPKNHPDYSILRSGLSKASNVLININEETRKFENLQKLSELGRILDLNGYRKLNVPGREFVMEGALFKAKSGRKLHGYLFNDVLILAEPLKSLSPEGYLYRLYREPMDIQDVSVRQQQNMSLKSSFSGNSAAEDTSFQIVCGSQIISVKAPTASQKRQWITQMQHYSALMSAIPNKSSSYYE